MRVKLAQISTLNLCTGTNIYILHHHIPLILRGQQCTVRGYELEGYVLKKKCEAYEGDEVMVP